MDSETVVAAPGIYKPEAKLNQVPTSKGSALSPIHGRMSELILIAG